MTDKNEFDQEDLNVAFERLNTSDGLQPSAELDAMILQMAADEVKETGLEDEQSNVTDISDISFRRGQRESHTSLKKKGLFPNWVMPLGLAATVLLSFGVVNRVLMSPEFDGLTKQSSYEAMSDEVIITSDSDSKIRANKDAEFSSFNKPEQPVSANVKRIGSGGTKAKVTVNGNDMNVDMSSLADAPAQPPAMIPPPKSDSVTKPSAVTMEVSRVESPVVGIEPEIQFGSEQQELESRQEQHAFLAKEKRERLTQARRIRAASEMQVAPVEAPVGFNVSEPETVASSAAPSLSSNGPVLQEVAGASRADNVTSDLEFSDGEFQAGIVSSVDSSLGEMDSVEEVIITGSRMKNDSDDLEALSDKAYETKRQVLQSVLFEHKQCQVKQDCALVALACDSCDCLKPVNNEHYQKYQSEISKSKIAEQCVNTSVECVRNYCQVQQSE